MEKWKAGEISGGVGEAGEMLSDKVRRYILEKHNYQCYRCGWGERNEITGKIPLHIDHIDGDPTNHAEVNLRAICPNCHSLTANFGALNKGKGRAFRRAKDRKYKYAKTFDSVAGMAESVYAPLP